MDTSAFFSLLFSSSPLLPGSMVSWLSLHLGWAVVLGTGVWLIFNWMLPRYRWVFAILAMLWTLLPNAASPAFWLGLAFQSPSLMSVVLCIAWLLPRPGRELGAADLGTAADSQTQKIFLVLGAVLGWVLLLDTLAWFPVSIYTWGFGSAAVALALLATVLLWLLLGSRVSASLLVVMALFVLTRAPTGNLWDALLDPLLWLALQLGWLFSVARRYWMSRRSLPATRA
jgi:hypothetical protein